MPEAEPSIELLLRLAQTALGAGEPRASDLRQLRFVMNQAEISPDNYLLLPLLTGLGPGMDPDDPVARKLQGIKRLTWYRNQLVLGCCARILSQFQDAGISTLLLGDLASTLLLYREQSIRPIHGLSMLVHTGHAAAAAGLLITDGWRVSHGLLPVNRDFLPGQRFSHKDFDFELELRWHVLPVCLFPGADDTFWSRARLLRYEVWQSLTLEPADLLLYFSVQAFYMRPSPAPLWIADAVRLIQVAGDEIDLPQLLATASSLRLLLPLRKMLGFLQDNLETNLPEDAERQLRDMPISHTERLETWYRQKPQQRRLPGNLPLLWFDYLRWRRADQAGGGKRVFTAYLARYWQVDGAAQVLAMMTRLAMRRTRAQCRDSWHHLWRGVGR